MPTQEDFAFWNAAKAQGRMTQEQVEESVELLFSLERVGSSKRAWEIAVKEGHLSAEQVAEIQQAAGKADAEGDAGEPAQEEAAAPAPDDSEGKIHALPEMSAGIEEESDSGLEAALKSLDQAVPSLDAESQPEEEQLAESPDETEAPKAAPEPAESFQLSEPLTPAATPSQTEEQDAEGAAETAEPAEEDETPREEAGPRLAPILQGYQVVFVESPRELKHFPVTARPMSIGSDSACNISLTRPGVADRHARLTTSNDIVSIWDMGTETGIRVNHERRTSCPLRAFDLIMVGSAIMIYVPDYGGEVVPQQTAPISVGGNPLAMFSVIEGPLSGTVFYLSEAPAVIGQATFACCRLVDQTVSPLHAHLIGHQEGVVISDLASSGGVLVNDRPVRLQVLKNGDRVKLGSVVLAIELLRSSKTVGPNVPMVEEALSANHVIVSKGKEDESSGIEWDISLNVELNESASAVMQEAPPPPQAGEATKPAPLAFESPEDNSDDSTLEAVKELATGPERDIEEPPPEHYSPGELILTCLEGPAEGRSWTLEKQSTTIGRDRNADITLRDLAVSRRHATILFTEQGVEARDLGSRNGIQVNGQRCRNAFIGVGDTVRVGTCLFLVDRADSKKT